MVMGGGGGFLGPGGGSPPSYITSPGRSLGRISGPLLSANLLRNGHNLAFDSNLLYIDVVNGYIGINTDSPTRNLTVNGTTDTTNLIVDTSAIFADLEFTTNQIQNVTGGITFTPYQSADPTVTVPKFKVSNLEFTNNSISNLTNNANIVLDPNGSGKVIFTTSKVNVNGSLHATGNITWDGSITLGNDNLDNVTFNADVNSKIIPDADNTYDIGASGKEWRNLYAHDLKFTNLTSSALTVNNINLLLTQGHTIYVSTSGSDTNTGTHLHNTYLTIKKALSVAQSGDEVVIFPGTYTEIFPLTIPQGVSVRGMDIRSVIVKPTAGTNTNNAFLLNGETTVSFLTVKDFYQGYAFSFAPNFTVTSRSPYVQHVTVITSESVVTTYSENYSLAASDWQDGWFYAQPNVNLLNLNVDFATPEFVSAITSTTVGTVFNITHNDNTTVTVTQTGDWTYFGNVVSLAVSGLSGAIKLIKIISWGEINTPQGDAGNGALVDGSLANSASREASMLFHSVTLIMPDAIGVKVTNGARVEWLNSFTYFANKGIYLTEGTLGFASLGVKFGAEMRSIGSANIYGTYGAYADGAHTLGYLIGHNFGYIGSGSDSQNDSGLVLQANEIVAINGGQLYYDSMDQKGDYRIGDIFRVVQETGQVEFNAQAISFTADGSITLEGVTGRTFIHAPAVEVGNIRIHDNNIDSTSGPVNFLAYSGSTYLNTNVTVTGNTGITGDTNIKGTLTTFGNEATDKVTILDQLTQTIKPDLNNTYTLGKITGTEKRWNILYATLLNVDGVTQVTNNTITTLTADTDLRLVASGSGIVNVTTTDVEITNNLTVVGSSDLQNVEILGNLNLPGGYTYSQTGTADRTGNTNITGHINVYGTHIVQFEDIKFDSNIITTTFGDHDLSFTADGLGIVNVVNTDVKIDNDLNVDLTGYFNSVNATNVTADAYDIDSVYITGNTITTNTTDTDLVLSADGSGLVRVSTTDVEITNDLTVSQSTTFNNDVTITGSLKLLGDNTYTLTGNATRIGNTDITGSLTQYGTYSTQFPDIEIYSNRIKAYAFIGNKDLILTADGTGIVKTLTTNVEISNDLTVLLNADIDIINATTVTANAYDIGNVYIDDNTITTLASNLILTASGAGVISVGSNDVEITNDLEVKQLTTLTNVGITGLLDLTGDYTWSQTGTTHRTGNTDITGSLAVNGTHTVQFDDIQIFGNTVKTTLGTNLELQANGFGIISIPTNNVEITHDLDVLLHGEIDTVNATTVTANAYNITDVYITGNTITTDFLNRNLSLSANGLGRIYVPSSDVEITNDLHVGTTTTLADVGITGLLDLTGDYTWTQTGTTHRTGSTDITGSLTVNGANTVQFDDIKFVSNRITTTVTDNDLTLTSDPAKKILVTTTDVEITNDLTVDDTGFFGTVEATTIQADSFDIGSVYITDNTITTNTTNTSLVLSSNGLGRIFIPLNDVSISNNLTITNVVDIAGDTSLKNTEIGTVLDPATLTQTGSFDQTGNTYVTGTFTNNGPITITGASSYLDGPNVKIQNHKISITTTDTDLNFVGIDAGGIVLDSKLKFKNSTISNVWDSPTTDTEQSIIFDPDGTGNVVIDAATSLTLPYGDSSNRILSAIGEIRQNSSTGHYEGWSPSGLVSFNGIYDSDSNTYITPELTFGANDNVIRFGINSVVRGTIDTTKLSTNTIHVDNISISGNTINNLVSTNDVELNVTGSGSVNINDILIKDNLITNTTNGALILESTGAGYIRFSGTGAVVFPAGGDADRRGTPELGEIRYNTDHNYTEIWEGTKWVSVSGANAAATEEEVVAETNLWAFVLG